MCDEVVVVHVVHVVVVVVAAGERDAGRAIVAPPLPSLSVCSATTDVPVLARKPSSPADIHQVGHVAAAAAAVGDATTTPFGVQDGCHDAREPDQSK